MKTSIFSRAMLAALALFTSCKTDKEGDIVPPPSTTTGLCINEIYSCNPDWIELYNSSDKEIDLGGYILRDDKGAAEEFILPAGTRIAAGAFLVFDETTDFQFGISSSKGDEVTLLDAEGNIVDAVEMPVIEDGKSYGREADGGDTWKVFDQPTKGIGNTEKIEPPVPGGLRLFINEVVSSPAEGEADWIELYNAEEEELDLGGFRLMDDKGEAEQFVLPEGTTIAAKGFLAYTQVSPSEGESFTFGLSSKGDRVILADREGITVDQVETPDFSSDAYKDKGFSYARTEDGGDNWAIVEKPTKGASNKNEAVEETDYTGVRLNEICGEQTPDDDWVEIFNASDRTVDLGGVQIEKTDEEGKMKIIYTFPEGTRLTGKSYRVIATLTGELTSGISNKKQVGIALLTPTGEKTIDRFDRDTDLGADVKHDENGSYARIPDGTGDWQVSATMSRGTANKQ